MRTATLSVDIDREFLGHPVARGGRVRRFITRAFAADTERSFAASWTQRPITVRRAGNDLTFPALDVSAFRAGDRLVLSASLEDASGNATLYDGAALLVEHILERADARFITDLLSESTPAQGLALVTEERRKSDWTAVLERAVQLAITSEIRTAASLRAITDFMLVRGVTVAIIPDADASHDDDELIIADELLDELLVAERAGRRRRVAQPGSDAETPLEFVAPVRRRRRLFQSERDLPRLMKMLTAIDEVVPLPRRPPDEGRLIDAVAAGRAVSGRG